VAQIVKMPVLHKFGKFYRNSEGKRECTVGPYTLIKNRSSWWCIHDNRIVGLGKTAKEAYRKAVEPFDFNKPTK